MEPKGAKRKRGIFSLVYLNYDINPTLRCLKIDNRHLCVKVNATPHSVQIGEVFDYIKINKKWTQKNYPELKELINQHNVKIQKKLEVKQIDIINNIISKLCRSEKSVSYEAIAKELCISRKMLSHNEVLINAVLEAKARHGLT
jgi:hypothetical protein